MNSMSRPKMLILAIVMISINGCEDAEIPSKDHPFLLMKEVRVSSNCVELFAEISNLGEFEVISYGFVWSFEQSPTLESGSFKVESTVPDQGIYSTKLQSGIREDQVYYVRPFLQSRTVLVYGSELSFTGQGSLSPEIEDFDPKFGTTGTLVEITGTNFGYTLSDTEVFFGDKKAQIDSIGDQFLLVRVPEINVPFTEPIRVVVAGMSAESLESFEVQYPWKEVTGKELRLNLTSRYFRIGDILYIIKANIAASGIKYDPKTLTWSSFSLPTNPGAFPKAFSINGKGYVIFSTGFFEFDPFTENWTQKADFPGNIQDGRYVFTLDLEQAGVVGFCHDGTSVWSYDPINNVWNPVANFPEPQQFISPVWGHFTFSIGNKGYLGVSRSSSPVNSFWEFDITTGNWTELKPHPREAYNSFASMTIEGEPYVGLGEKFTGSISENTSVRIWKYNIGKNEWTSYKDSPVPMAVSISYNFEGKGYVIPDFTRNYDSYYQIWEFNPSNN
jgi:hypothetical protein